MTVTFFANTAMVPPLAYVIAILDKSDDVTDLTTLGEHAQRSSVVFGRVFVDPVLAVGGTIFYDDHRPDTISVSSVLSHEVAELYIDPYVNMWSDGPRLPEGSEYGMECCDPVENDFYAIDIVLGDTTTRVSVSNFVMPAWFNIQALSGPYDYLNKLRKPFSMTTDGYMVVRSKPGSVSQIYGSRYPAWRLATKLSLMARTRRRSR